MPTHTHILSFKVCLAVTAGHLPVNMMSRMMSYSWSEHTVATELEKTEAEDLVEEVCKEVGQKWLTRQIF